MPFGFSSSPSFWWSLIFLGGFYSFLVLLPFSFKRRERKENNGGEEKRKEEKKKKILVKSNNIN